MKQHALTFDIKSIPKSAEGMEMEEYLRSMRTYAGETYQDAYVIEEAIPLLYAEMNWSRTMQLLII